jgi:hypothetical protein
VVGNDSTADRFGGIEAVPITFLIDRYGKIANVHVGLTSKGEFENAIGQLLEVPVSGLPGIGTSPYTGADAHCHPANFGEHQRQGQRQHGRPIAPDALESGHQFRITEDACMVSHMC